MFAGLIEASLQKLGPVGTLAFAGLCVGFLFGFMAQKSRFCLRSAVIEFVTARFGSKLAIWLLTFGIAIVVIQFMVAHGALSVSTVAALNAPGSISGALIGGAMFGAGMVLARGCASRLLVLSGTGNMRAMIAGLVFVVVTQSAYQGALEPLRSWLGSLWMVDGGPLRDIILRLGGREVDKFPFALIWLAAAFAFALRGRIGFWGWVGGMGCGAAVALAYYLTFAISQAAMTPDAVKGITFSGPSAEFLMRILQHGEKPLGFDTMLIPGVFLGAGIAALMAGEWKLTVFDTSSGTVRYMVGAALMGFGAMLAGGCAVGAGVSGGAIFALTAWIALILMWVGAGLTHWLVDERARIIPKDIKSGRLASARAG